MDEMLAYVKLFIRNTCGNGWLPLLIGVVIIVISVFFSSGHNGNILWIVLGGALVIFGIGVISGIGVFSNLII